MSEIATPVPAPSRRPHKRVGPYSKRGALALLDGRSKEALFMRRRRAELVVHVGGKPSATQAALIDRCCWLELRLAKLDERMVGDALTDHDCAAYLAWSNALTRALARLGLEAAAPPPLTLDQHQAALAAAAAAGRRAAAGKEPTAA